MRLDRPYWTYGLRTARQAVFGRRSFLNGLAGVTLAVSLGAAIAPSAAKAAAGSDGAAAFLDDLGTRAVELLSDDSVPEAEREAAFDELLRGYFDVPAISRFIMGRYWRRMDDRQKAEFTSVFKRVMAKRFVPWFAGSSTDQFAIGRVAQDSNNKKLFNVLSDVSLPSGEVVKATWRIRQGDKDYRVVDIVANGVSMALTLRSEYGSLLNQSNGDVDSLIELLETRVGADA